MRTMINVLAIVLLSFYTSSIAFAQQKSLLKRPNVLLITVDDLNAWVGHLDKHPLAYTPNIDKLAARSVSFTNTHAAAPVCASSRAALMTGVYPHKSGLYSNAGHNTSAHDVIDNVPHLAPLFRDSGYRILGAGKIYHQWVTDGGDQLDAKTYDAYLPKSAIMPTKAMLVDGNGYGGKKGNKFYPFPDGGSRLTNELGITRGHSLAAGVVSRNNMRDEKMPDEVLADWGVEQLAHYGNMPYAKQPFFMTMGFIRPHVPYAVPKEYIDLFPLESIKLPHIDNMKDIPLYGKAMTMGNVPGGDHQAVLALGDTFWRELMQGYLASIAFVDAQVGRIIDALEDNGLADNTLIILTSDHGQNFGEKSNWRKMSLWEESTRVPLLIHLPNNPNHGKSIGSAVSLLDIYPTLIKHSQLAEQSHVDGRDLSPLLAQPELLWDHPVLTAWHYKNFAVRSNRYRYIQYRDGSEELYDHQNDPLELINIAQGAENVSIKQHLKHFIPTDVALPYGMKTWQGDHLDKFINSWQVSGEPSWLGKSATSTKANIKKSN